MKTAKEQWVADFKRDLKKNKLKYYAYIYDEGEAYEAGVTVTKL